MSVMLVNLRNSLIATVAPNKTVKYFGENVIFINVQLQKVLSTAV